MEGDINEKLCKICYGKHAALGYCAKHYKRLRSGWAEDELHLKRRPRPRSDKSCKICGGEHAALGYCDKHYQQHHRNGWTDQQMRDAKPRPKFKCSVPHCWEPMYKIGMLSTHGNARSRELCREHYRYHLIILFEKKLDAALEEVRPFVLARDASD